MQFVNYYKKLYKIQSFTKWSRHSIYQVQPTNSSWHFHFPGCYAERDSKVCG